jgi:hypothetical protein
MKADDMIAELQDLARQLGVTIRFERGDFEGGYCILKTRKVLLVNKRLMSNRKAAVLAVALNEVGLENLFVKPAVREFVEDEVAKARRSAAYAREETTL